MQNLLPYNSSHQTHSHHAQFVNNLEQVPFILSQNSCEGLHARENSDEDNLSRFLFQDKPESHWIDIFKQKIYNETPLHTLKVKFQELNSRISECEQAIYFIACRICRSATKHPHHKKSEQNLKRRNKTFSLKKQRTKEKVEEINCEQDENIKERVAAVKKAFQEKRRKEVETVKIKLDKHINMNIKRSMNNNSDDKNTERKEQLGREGEEDGKNLNLGIFSEVKKKNQSNPDEYELRIKNKAKNYKQWKQNNSKNKQKYGQGDSLENMKSYKKRLMKIINILQKRPSLNPQIKQA